MGLVAMHNKLNEMLFDELLAGRRLVLIVDEAQNLESSVLETIRLLSNFETSNTKLLQIVLAGQPQLADKLAQPQLEQLSQRITVVQKLEPFSPEEAAAYIRHRIKVGGNHDDELFAQDALALIAAQSRGIPRNINRICYHALLEAHAQGARVVTPDIVEKAGRKLQIFVSAKPDPPATARPTSEEPGPDTGPITSDAAKAAAAAFAPTPLTYKPVSGIRPRGRNIWTGGLAAILLAGVAATPHFLWGEVFHSLSGRMSQTFGAMNTHPARSVIAADAPVAPPPGGSESAGTRVPSERPRAVTSVPQASVSNIPAAANSAPANAIPLVGNAASPDTTRTLARTLGLKINRIAIDPGHGGSDTGAMSPHGLLEKDLCLDVAQRLGHLIAANLEGAEVIYTRQDDSFVPLERRTDIANRAGADLFISIHANSSDLRYVRGVETYYLNLSSSPESMQLATRENALGLRGLHDLPDLLQKIARNEKSAESKELAGEIQDALSQRLQLVSRGETNRGVKQAPFIVLTGAQMPAVLSEISFVSNARDENLLQDTEQRERVAEGLYRGIAAYLNNLNAATYRRGKLVSENEPHTISIKTP